MKKYFVLLLSLLAALLFAGCATTDKPEAKKAGDDEYVYLPPATGSNVPRKVKKSDLVNGTVPNDGYAPDGSPLAGSMKPANTGGHGAP